MIMMRASRDRRHHQIETSTVHMAQLPQHDIMIAAVLKAMGVTASTEVYAANLLPAAVKAALPQSPPDFAWPYMHMHVAEGEDTVAVPPAALAYVRARVAEYGVPIHQDPTNADEVGAAAYQLVDVHADTHLFTFTVELDRRILTLKGGTSALILPRGTQHDSDAAHTVTAAAAALQARVLFNIKLPGGRTLTLTLTRTFNKAGAITREFKCNDRIMWNVQMAWRINIALTRT